jgi:hypothetical protein
MKLKQKIQFKIFAKVKKKNRNKKKIKFDRKKLEHGIVKKNQF